MLECNSMSNKFDEIILPLIEKEIDILAINETKIDKIDILAINDI